MIAEQLKIDAGTVAGWLAEKKPVTILDVRPQTEREEWSIPGSVHADVYDRLKAGETNVFANHILPNAPIVTVCTAGKTSLLAAEQLKQKGYEVYSLDGGMKAWNFVWNTAEAGWGNLKVIQVRRSAKGCLSYIVGSGAEAIVIDAALDPEVYEDLAGENGWKISYVTDTHIHADYLSRTRELAEKTGATHVMLSLAQVDYAFTPIKDEDKLFFGAAALEVIHTPGHTPESTSFRIGPFLFTGDTLFTDGVGRPDLKANAEEAERKAGQLYVSLEKLLGLDPSTLVLPAHSSKTVPFDNKLVAATIAELHKNLPMLKLDKDDFVKYTLQRIPPTPPNYLTIAGLNKTGSYEGHQPAELEAGANRCAIS